MSAPLRFAQLGTAHAHAPGKAAVMRDAVRLCLDRARDGVEQGMQQVPREPEPRHVASLAAIVAVICGEQSRDRSKQHEVPVQETSAS